MAESFVSCQRHFYPEIMVKNICMYTVSRVVFGPCGLLARPLDKRNYMDLGVFSSCHDQGLLVGGMHETIHIEMT